MGDDCVINIILNSKMISIEENKTLSDELKNWGYDEKMVAVAVNRQFVARDSHDSHILQDGDEVDVVSPMQGG